MANVILSNAFNGESLALTISCGDFKGIARCYVECLSQFAGDHDTVARQGQFAI